MKNENLIVNSDDLYTIGDNINYLSDCIDKVSTDINSINGNVDKFQEQIDVMKNNVSSLESEVRTFMNEMKQNILVGNAKQSIMLSQLEYEKKYGYRDDVRRRVVGLLQSVDINAIKKNTMENIGEETIVNNPDYWLAPALVALCYWYTDNKKMAKTALKKAMSRSDEKTSFLFFLIHLRAGRTNTAIKWLNRYLSLQDPTNMDSKIILVLDALCSGVFNAEIADILLKKINTWCLQLNNYSEYKTLQVDRWEKYFKNKEVVGKSIPDYISKYVIQNDKISNMLHYSNFHINMMEEIKTIVDDNNISNYNHLDKILNMLIFDYEDEELNLKSEIVKNNNVVNLIDDSKSNNYLNDKLLYYSRNDFYTHVSNLGLNSNLLNINLNTKKMAISFCKNYIVEAYKKVTNMDYKMDLVDLTISIDDWYGNTKDGSNELELKKSLENHINNKYYDYISKHKFISKEMIISVVFGLFAIIFSYKWWPLILIITMLLLIYNGLLIFNNIKIRKMKLNKFNEDLLTKKEILTNTICEIVDCYFIYKDSKKRHIDFISYIESLNYNDYIKLSSVNKRKNIFIGGKK